MEQIKEEIVRPIQKRVTRFHIIQSTMAGAYILLAFLIMHLFHSELAVTSLGASAFIVFSSPSVKASRPQFMICGYCLGTISGLLCCGLVILLQDLFPFSLYIPACALAVIISMLLMTTLNLQHPPSAALAVSITIAPNPVVVGLAGLGCILLLCAIRQVIKKRLRDL